MLRVQVGSGDRQATLHALEPDRREARAPIIGNRSVGWMIAGNERLVTYSTGTLFACAVLSFLTSCGRCLIPTDASTELVMQPRARFEAQDRGFRIAIIAGEGNERRYEWGNCSLTAHPCARGKRWYGSLGIYDPAPGVAYMFSGCDGVSRPVVEEGQIHFQNQSSAEAWIERYARVSDQSTVWTHDGLLISWRLTRERGQLSVDVYQVCIGGQTPQTLAGATDAAITVTAASDKAVARHDCATVSPAVAVETERVWAELWRQADEFAKRVKATDGGRQ